MKKGSIFEYSETGPREENEDSVGVKVYTKNIIAVLADGLGGQEDGKAASGLIVENLLLCGQEEEFPDTDQIRSAIFYANDAILQRRQGDSGMKSTAVYLCIGEDRAVWAHTGDSRLYHFYGKTEDQYEMKEYTLDHSIPQLAVYMGEITREEIRSHPGRNRLIHVLGVEDPYCVVAEPVRLDPGYHAFLLCSDGFWECMEEENFCQQLQEKQAAEDWILSMVQKAQQDGKEFQDNYSAIGILLEV